MEINKAIEILAPVFATQYMVSNIDSLKVNEVLGECYQNQAFAEQLVKTFRLSSLETLYYCVEESLADVTIAIEHIKRDGIRAMLHGYSHI